MTTKTTKTIKLLVLILVLSLSGCAALGLHKVLTAGQDKALIKTGTIGQHNNKAEIMASKKEVGGDDNSSSLITNYAKSWYITISEYGFSLLLIIIFLFALYWLNSRINGRTQAILDRKDKTMDRLMQENKDLLKIIVNNPSISIEK